MAYLIGSLLGNVIGAAIRSQIHNNRLNAAVAHWYSPLSRPGPKQSRLIYLCPGRAG